ncbi:MAG: hypothetical protein H6841_09950 [Planctomycetes bacterium]|nr:hypothetical protein [Planctomycetota bacterium]
MKLLKQHARFLVVMVVLAVVLVLANSEFSGIAESLDAKETQATSLLQKNYRALFADAAKFNGDPATIQGRRMQDKTKVSNAITGIVNDRMSFQTDPAYTVDALPQDAVDDMVHYLRNVKKLEMQRELGLRRYFGPDVRADDAFGFKIPDGALTADQVRDYLRKLDIVRAAAWSAEVSRVQLLTRLQFVSINEGLSSRGVPTKPATQTEKPYLNGEGLKLSVLATEESLYNLLIALQNPEKNGKQGRYLAIEEFKFEKPDLLDPKDALIVAEITVVAYSVNPESTYPPDDSQKTVQQTTAGQPRKFR